VLTNATGLPVASLIGEVSLANGGTAANLTASNGGSSAVDLGIARVVVSDTTNTTLIEERV
jgi:hypothetical protein